MKQAVIFVLFLWSLVVLPACGYHLSSSSPIDLPQGMTRLCLDRVENPSTEAWLESRLISEVRDEFTRRGQVAWVGKDHAQGLLSLIITRYADQTKVENADEQTVKSEIILSLQGKMVSADTNEVLWISNPVHARESFTGASEKRRAEEQVVQDAAQALADQLGAGF